MANDITQDKKYDVQKNDYDGGTNYVIKNNDTGRSASVAVTKDGLVDVQTDKGNYTYTGKDQGKAAEAVKNHIG